MRGFLNWLAPPLKPESELQTNDEREFEAMRGMLRRQFRAADEEDLTDRETLRENQLDEALHVGWRQVLPRGKELNVDDVLQQQGAAQAPVLRTALRMEASRATYTGLPRDVADRFDQFANFVRERVGQSSSSSSQPANPIPAAPAFDPYAGANEYQGLQGLFGRAEQDAQVADLSGLDDLFLQLDDYEDPAGEDLRESAAIDLRDVADLHDSGVIDLDANGANQSESHDLRGSGPLVLPEEAESGDQELAELNVRLLLLKAPSAPTHDPVAPPDPLAASASLATSDPNHSSKISSQDRDTQRKNQDQLNQLRDSEPKRAPQAELVPGG